MPRGRGRHHRKLIRRLRARWLSQGHAVRVRVYRGLRGMWTCVVDTRLHGYAPQRHHFPQVYVGARRVNVLRAALGDAG